jgi:2'-5' RNA ligase
MTDGRQERTRFIIVSVLPDHAAEAVREIREPCCRLTGSREALAYPPHITLRTGVLVPPAEREKFIGEFEALTRGVQPFALRTNGILVGRLGGEYGDAPIACYKIAPNEYLVALNRRLNRYTPYRKSNRTAFHPHVSLAYGDLTENGLREIGKFLEGNPALRDREVTWICDHVSLYVKKDEQWVNYHRIPLNAAP